MTTNKEPQIENAIQRESWMHDVRGFRLLALMMVASGIVSAGTIGFVLKIFY